MSPCLPTTADAAFARYTRELAGALGHSGRLGALRWYLEGLLLPGECKSVEAMAPRVAPTQPRTARVGMNHLVGQAPWSDRALYAAVGEALLPLVRRASAELAWIVEVVDHPRSGGVAVGAARQARVAGAPARGCQRSVVLALAGQAASVPVAHRLFLPRVWADDPARREQAGVPDHVGTPDLAAIALAQIAAARAEGLPLGPVCADAALGAGPAFRQALTAMGLPFMLEVPPETLLWAGDREATAAALAGDGTARFSPVPWIEGLARARLSRFAAWRVRVPRDRDRGREASAELWLLAEWPLDAPAPGPFWLASLGLGASPDPDASPARAAGLASLARLAKLRWRTERDLGEMRDDLGLDHYVGRGWRGYHHHVALVVAAYAFRAAGRLRTEAEHPHLRVAFLPAGPTPAGASLPPA